MRVFTAVVIWTLAVEALLGLAFLAGWYWIGGWQAGLAVAGVALLVSLLPWVGELRAEYDSEGGKLDGAVGWWGRVSLRDKPDAILELRVLGIPWRQRRDRPKKAKAKRAPAAREAPAEKARPRKRRAWRVTPDRASDLGRALFAALAAGNDLVWDARELHLQVDSPSGHKTPDEILAKVVGHRGVDPIDIKLNAGEGKRRIRARYRIGLFRALVICVCAACQGRVCALKDMRAPKEESPSEASDEDRELIAELQEQLAEQQEAKEEE